MLRISLAGAWSVLGAIALTGCGTGVPNMAGSASEPSLSALQAMCGASTEDYGAHAQSVYSAFFDAYVAQKRGKLPKEQYCGFQAGIASQYVAYASNHSAEAQSTWANFFADQRAQAISWRASVDTTLRGG